MMKNDGKITFFGLVGLVVIVYGIFVAYMFISSNLMQAQLEKEVIDTFGPMRGDSFKPEKARELILEIIKKNPVTISPDDEGRIEVLFEDVMIRFQFEYDVELDLILFKNKKHVQVKNEMRRYS